MSRILLPLRALRRRFGVALGALLLGSAAAQAQTPTIYGLGTLTQTITSPNVFGLPNTPAGSQGIVPFNPTTGPTGNPILVTGVTAGQKLVGTDYRPATGVLYALGYDPSLSTANAQLYTLAPATGVATPVNTIPTTLALGASVTRIGFDFNPTVDLIRVVATNGANYRLNPNTGATNNTDGQLAYATGDANTGQAPGVGTAAYTNSVLGATTTTLYDIDELNGARLVTQDPPNTGTLNTVAAIDNPASFVNFGLALGLDIDVYYNPATGTNQAYLMEVAYPNQSGSNIGYSSSNIYSINLGNGQTSNKLNLVPALALTPFNIYDIAVVIAPPACDAPTALAVSNITSSSATVSFTGSASARSGYTVTTSPATTTQTLPVGATSVDLTGLDPNTSYTVNIASNCAGGVTSSTATVSFVTAPNPVPAITSLSPASATAGAAAQTLTVNGTDFVNGSTVSFNGTARTTTFVSATQLTVQITAADQATPGSYPVTVTNAAPGGGTSNTATFTVNPAPCTAPSGLTASSVTSSSATVTFTGSGTATGYTVTTSPASTPQTLPAGATSVSFSGLTPSTAYTVSIVSNCAGGATSGAATVGFTTTAASPFTITWTGFASDEWTNPINWQPNRVPTSTDDVFIPGTYTPGSPLSTSTFPGTTPTPNQPVVRVAGQVTRVLFINTGASLTIATAGTLSVSGDFTNNGNGITSNSTGRVLLAGPTVQTVGGSSLTTFPNLTVGTAGATTSGPVAILPTAGLTLNGNLTIGSGQAFTLRSDATGTAYVVNNSGSIATGLATVQRYITPTNAGPGYRHYSSPVTSNTAAATSNTVADLATASYNPVVNSAYNSSNTPRLVQPYPNVFYYDQSRLATSNSSYAVGEFDNGFLSPGALTDALTTGRGYTVNLSGTELVDFQGTLNTGTYSRTNLARGAQTTAGYHLLGNPYPSAINYDIVRANSTGIEGALYVFKSSGQYTGSYTSYVNGQNTNTGTNTLPVAQGFFVRVAAGQTGAVTFTNASRVNAANNTPFQRTTADTRPRLTLSLGTTSLRTQTVMYFETGATAAFDAAFDAHYLPATNGLTLATETPAAELLSISGQPALTGTDVVLPLRLATAAAGTYTLAVDDLSNLPAGYHAYLRDALTGTYTDLGATPTVNLTLAANAAAGGRYAAVFTTQARVLATAPAALAKLATVYPNPAHGSATLLLPVALRGQQATVVTVVDNLGRAVLSRTLAVGTAETLELPLAGLAPGVYSVQARTAAGLVAKRLVVE